MSLSDTHVSSSDSNNCQTVDEVGHEQGFFLGSESSCLGSIGAF